MKRPFGFLLLAPLLALLAALAVFGLLKSGGEAAERVVFARTVLASVAATSAVAAEALWAVRPWAVRAVRGWALVVGGWYLLIAATEWHSVSGEGLVFLLFVLGMLAIICNYVKVRMASRAAGVRVPRPVP